MQQRGIAVFGADLWASDWNPMTPAQQLKLLTERLQVARKGIILLHDPKAQTAAMLPAFLRYLRDNHYRVVHLVPAGAKDRVRQSTLDIILRILTIIVRLLTADCRCAAPRITTAEGQIRCRIQAIKAAFMTPDVKPLRPIWNEAGVL